MYLLPAILLSQNPVINPRGVLNPVTMEPAPSRVTRGGPILITGINLGPVEEVKATGSPLPTQLAEPAVQVLINNRRAPLFSVGPTRILAQVPWEIQAGGGQGILARVVVRRGEVESQPATVRIVNSLPGIRTSNNQGWGPAGRVEGGVLQLSLTGLGQTDPAGKTGEVAEGEAKPVAPVRAYIGGFAAKVEATLSTATVGDYTARIEMPADAKPGDIVSVIAANAASNRALVGNFEGGMVQYARLPAGANGISVLRAADLRGNFLVAHGPRGDDGCYPSWLFDLGRGVSSKIEPCLIAANANAATPVGIAAESAALTALVGPAVGDAASGVSSKIAIFRPDRADPMLVELPAPVSNVNGAANGTITAIQPGETPRVYSVNPDTGEVTEPQLGGAGGAGGAVGAGGGAAGAGGAGVNLNVLLGTFTIDLGDGLTHLLSAPINIGQGRFVAVVGNEAERPTRAKLAILNQALEVTDTRAWPDGWTALVALPNAAPGGNAPVNPAARFRATQLYDAATQTLFVLSRKADGSAHSWLAFAGAELEPSAVEFPAGTFAATCRPQNLQLFNLELSRRVALFSADRESAEVANPCPANGWLLLDLATRTLSAVSLPGAGSVNTRNNAGDVNDFLYAANNDPSNRNISDTLFVLDSAAGSAFRLDLPPGVNGFTGIQPVPELSGLLAVATNQVAGDAGLVFFDLTNEKQTLLTVPEGFATVAAVGVFPTTRKIVARGTKTGNTGSQYLVYEIATGELTLAENPDGVAFVGVLPAQGGGAAGGGQGGGGVPPGGGGVPPGGGGVPPGGGGVPPGGGGVPPGGGGVPPGGGGVPGGGAAGGGGGAAAQAAVQTVSTKSNVVTSIAYGANRQPVGVISIRVPSPVTKVRRPRGSGSPAGEARGEQRCGPSRSTGPIRHCGGLRAQTLAAQGLRRHGACATLDTARLRSGQSMTVAFTSRPCCRDAALLIRTPGAAIRDAARHGGVPECALPIFPLPRYRIIEVSFTRAPQSQPRSTHAPSSLSGRSPRRRVSIEPDHHGRRDDRRRQSRRLRHEERPRTARRQSGRLVRPQAGPARQSRLGSRAR
ncbi:MAG: hypothetical protein R2762_13515 [Bryobacteraceae bacterium]